MQRGFIVAISFDFQDGRTLATDPNPNYCWLLRIESGVIIELDLRIAKAIASWQTRHQYLRPVGETLVL
jgi:hypothetical protein